VIGLAIFGEKPDPVAVTGIALILTAGLAVSYRRGPTVSRARPEET
jgi:drug/metabolite transporter (DMT)-like permease